ncbi:TPA: ribbon-helix-helix protein, CopG family [Pasteurella multocida]|nr:ribbon-helix-helix protein, CopG family [Pasteurella multocida]
MRYENLSLERRRAISKNADAYNKENYKTITVRLLPETFEKLEQIIKKEGLSRNKAINKLIEEHKKP